MKRSSGFDQGPGTRQTGQRVVVSEGVSLCTASHSLRSMKS